MDLIFEQECPQCGGAVELTESDHLLPCPYCNTRSFLAAGGPLRFILPPKITDSDIYFVPYLRFRGSVYSCHNSKVSHKIIDITKCGIPGGYFPHTLGLRAQAMKMRFASPDQPGTFIKCAIKLRDILDNVDNRVNKSTRGSVTHRAFIGETVSLIYLPAFEKNKHLFDAITNVSFSNHDIGFDVNDLYSEPDTFWKPEFIATICPKCGWNLEGERDSVVLACGNCETFWSAKKDRFVKIPYNSVSAPLPNSDYLPFWKIEVKASGINLDSFNDFLSSTKQPRVPSSAADQGPMSFFIPAFKIKPKIFLRISTQLTLGQRALIMENEYPDQPFHQVNLSFSEAIQSLKTVLASAAVNKHEIIPLLPGIEFNIRGLTLVFIPFTNSGYGLFQEHCKVNINRQVLGHGQAL